MYCTYYVLIAVAAADAELNVPLDLTVSDSLCCSYCRTTFKDKSEQRNHYKLDWHRHNLKQSLKGMKFLSEEEFLKLAGILYEFYVLHIHINK
jgi:hypothetical protein